MCLTAYTAPMAELLDSRCDLLLVGDSVGMVVHGLPTTVGVTLDMMILHGQAVMRRSTQAFVVVDMPFGSYEASLEQAFTNAARVMKETGCQAVKIEAGRICRGYRAIPCGPRHSGDGACRPAAAGDQCRWGVQGARDAPMRSAIA